MIIGKIYDSIKFASLTESQKYVVIASDYPTFSAIKKKEENTLFICFNKYIFKKNDQIVDKNDMSYFVKEVDSNAQITISNHTFAVQKIIYEEQPLNLPSYITQNTNSSININATGASLNDINVSSIISQEMNYTKILFDLETVINNCYHVKDYKEMISIFKPAIDNKEKIEESKIKKFFKFMGTQVKRLVELFLAAYATTLAKQML